MKRATTAVLAFAAATLVPAMALAAPDQYLGDASIYGSTGGLQPNVLIIIDNSGSMQDKVPGDPYDPAVTYPAAKACGSNGQTTCKATAIYTSKKTELLSDVNNVTTSTKSCGGANPQDTLKTTGLYRGRSLFSDGSCTSKGSSTYYLGNYLNYLKSPISTMRPKIDIAKDVVKEVIASTSGVKFGLMVYNYPGTTGQGGRFLSTSVPGTTTKYVSTVKDMDAIFSGTITNRTALVTTVGALSPLGNTPLGETLFEAMRYFSGEASAFGNTIGITGGKYTSPVEAPCQINTVIFVSDGMANADNDPVLKTLCTNGDCDGDGVEPGNLNHILDDVAKTMNLSPQNVTTYTIGFGLTGADADAVALLKRTADSNHGKGEYFDAGSQQELSNAFNQVIINIFSVDTSIAAPVVPVSPENRTYGSGRVFMGFFKPANDAFWRGNLKKYGVSAGNNPTIMDMTNAYATYMDEDSNGKDDNTGTPLPADAINGTFKDTAKSYWSAAADGSQADKGGAGQLLQAKEASSRTIYTVTPTGTTLVAFNTTNVTPAMLGVTDTAARDELVGFIRGQDVNDENKNGATTDNRPWTMGDVLHSKPLVVNYDSYQFTPDNEKNCTVNTSVIYVGANDGMLHAFRDCDGSELWGFIPPTLLPNLQYLKDQTHTYFVDSTPVAYIHDMNKDGKIEPTKGDKAILIFGTRRGGGTATTKATGSYFALNVTNQAAPELLWSISNTSPTSGTSATPVFAELAQSWSEPKIVRMKIGSSDKIVAIIGAGYDNVNEDGRFGATQRFSGTATVFLGEPGDGAATSPGTSDPLNPTGRGIYLIEVGTPTSGGLNLASSGTKIGEFTASSYPSMTFSFPSEIAAIDVSNNGYTSRLYAADTGGNIWRFDVGDPDKAKWSARKFFSSNPGAGGSSDVGRKIFSKPSVVSEYGSKIIFFGTGDREHPLNTAVVDRIYALIDRDQTFTSTESYLLDVTTDQLQTTTVASGAGSIKDLLDRLNATSNYGWYIKLNENSGEKVLSSTLVFNKVAYVTTHTPNTVTTSTDPCASPNNLGTGRVYALRYNSGEAVMNYDKTNDSSTTTNKRAVTPSGILLRSDRVKTIGSGIPSGVGIMLTPGGGSKLLIGISGAIGTENPPPGGGIIPLYWRQK